MNNCPKCGAGSSSNGGWWCGSWPDDENRRQGAVCLERQRDALAARAETLEERVKELEANQCDEVPTAWVDKALTTDPSLASTIPVYLRKFKSVPLYLKKETKP